MRSVGLVGFVVLWLISIVCLVLTRCRKVAHTFINN